jgi:hypothetical protein
MPLQKTDTRLICAGLITLHRLYMGASPDECGTVAQWEAILWPMYNALPFPDLWRGLDVKGIHMDSDLIEAETKAQIANLQDFDPARPGYQVAAGLYWNRDRLEVGFFPNGWKPEDAPQVRPLDPAKVAAQLMVLAHESGHFYADICGFFKTNTLIQRELTRLFNELRPKQADTPGEDIAEVFRAFFGPPGARGFFSDNKPYNEASNPALYKLMSLAFWLSWVLNGVDFTDLKVMSDGIWWQQWKQVQTGWFMTERVKDAIYKVDLQLRKWKWGETTPGQWAWIRV